MNEESNEKLIIDDTLDFDKWTEEVTERLNFSAKFLIKLHERIIELEKCVEELKGKRNND